MRQSRGLIWLQGNHRRCRCRGSPNDSINVAAGTYKETVTIGKPLSLIGADSSKVIIDATGLGNGIYVDGIDNKGAGRSFYFGIQRA